MKQQNGKPRVYAIASGKGGVGKTNLAANLAVALGGLGRRVLLFDADLGMANTEVLFGLTPRQNVRHVVEGGQPLRNILIDGPEGIEIAPAGSGVAALAELPSGAGDALVKELSSLAVDYDEVLIDAPPGIGTNALRFALMADELLVVLTPEPTSVADAYALVKLVRQKRPDMPLRLIINMAMGAEESARVAEAFGEITSRFLGMNVRSLGDVPWDDCVPDAVRRQKPFVICYPNCRAARRVRDMGRALSGPRERHSDQLLHGPSHTDRISKWMNS